MKRLFSLIVCLFSMFLASCLSTGSNLENEEFLLSGHFLRINEDLCILVLDDETREVYPDDIYMKLLTDHSFVEDDKQVSLDDFSDGDLIGVNCLTISDLSPRVIDVLGVKLLEEGSISYIDFDAFSCLEVDLNTSDIERTVLDMVARLNGISQKS